MDDDIHLLDLFFFSVLGRLGRKWILIVGGTRVYTNALAWMIDEDFDVSTRDFGHGSRDVQGLWVGVVSWAVPDNQYWSTLRRMGWHGNPDDRCLGI